ncbi:MAG: radical SAM protein [Candidatus Methanofastidiosa archaeon]|jgi:biotin synthase|nr:radical SAM protein [Candidatus Methanofastidiosa archaeon]
MISELLNEDDSSLFKDARSIAKKREILFFSPLFITTECNIKPLCNHCLWTSLKHYTADFWRRYSLEEVIKKAIYVEKLGIKRTMMPSGWLGYDLPDYFYEYIRGIKEHTNLELIGFSGAINKESLFKLKKAGIDGYWCGLETLNKDIFEKIRPGDDLNARIKTLRNTKEMGLLVWSSFVLGIGENEEDIIRQINLLKELEADNVAIQPFRPAPYTEMEKCNIPSPYWLAKIIATTRLSLEKPDIATTSDFTSVVWGIRGGANAFWAVWTQEDIDRIRNEFKFFHSKDNIN